MLREVVRLIEGADEFWRQKAYRTRSGRVIKATDAGLYGDLWTYDHDDILDWGIINHGLIGIGDRGGEGFIGHDGRFYTRDERLHARRAKREMIPTAGVQVGTGLSGGCC
jgi:hypothetical protein